MIALIAYWMSSQASGMVVTDFDVQRCSHSIAIDSQLLGLTLLDFLLEWNLSFEPQTAKDAILAMKGRRWILLNKREFGLRLFQEAMRLDMLEVWILQTYPEAELLPLTEEYCELVFANVQLG